MHPARKKAVSERVENVALGGQESIAVAIILAGGFGTRLKTEVPGLPKCMAPVAGKPFLHYVITYFKKQGIEKFIFSLGHLSGIIEKFLVQELAPPEYELSIEKQPLGTGGAIKLACGHTSVQTIAVINGDTFFKISLKELSSFHHKHNADCTLCLKPMQNFDRYGAVELRGDQSIKNFAEKNFYPDSLINGGVYGLNVRNFLAKDLPEKFSFEKDYLEKFGIGGRLMGLVQDGYFIDIGIPADYQKAQGEMSNEK